MANPPARSLATQLGALSLNREDTPLRSANNGTAGPSTLKSSIQSFAPSSSSSGSKSKFSFNFPLPSTDSPSNVGGARRVSSPRKSSGTRVRISDKEGNAQADTPSEFKFSFTPPKVHDNGREGRLFQSGVAVDKTFSIHLLHDSTPLPSPSLSREVSPEPSCNPVPAIGFNFKPPTSTVPSASTAGQTAASGWLSVSPGMPSSSPKPRPSAPAPNPKIDTTTLDARRHTRSVSEVATSHHAVDQTPTPYDPKDEAAPVHPFFSTTFQTALKDGANIAKETIFRSRKLAPSYSPKSDPNLNRFIQDAGSLMRFQGSDTRTIAVLGDSGEGKLLD